MSDEHDWEDGNFVEYAESEISEKLYTAADLEQARADERTKCIHVAKLELISPEGTDGLLGNNEAFYNRGVNDVVRAIDSLGPIGETRSEPKPAVDDLLLQEIFSLREKLKIAIDAIKSYNPEFDAQLFAHRLGAVDYEQLMEELNGERPKEETREKMERRVRQTTVEACRKALHDEPIWTPGTIDRALDAIAEDGVVDSPAPCPECGAPSPLRHAPGCRVGEAYQ